MLREWRLSNTTQFRHYERIVLDARKKVKINQHTRQKKHQSNDKIKHQFQSATDKRVNTRLKNVDNDHNKKALLKVDEDNAKHWVEGTLKKIIKKYGSVGATIIKDMMKEVHSTPQNI